jgi:hypothetical protein
VTENPRYPRGGPLGVMYLRGLEMQRAQERMGTRNIQVTGAAATEMTACAFADAVAFVLTQAELQRREKVHEWIINSERLMMGMLCALFDAVAHCAEEREKEAASERVIRTAAFMCAKFTSRAQLYDVFRKGSFLETGALVATKAEVPYRRRRNRCACVNVVWLPRIGRGHPQSHAQVRPAYICRRRDTW